MVDARAIYQFNFSYQPDKMAIKPFHFCFVVSLAILGTVECRP